MSVARAERLVNLVLCLLSTRQYLTAERIKAIVPGYADAANQDAFFRMFERDKAELRDLGVPLETGRHSSFDPEGYRIARRNYELGDIDLEPDEAAAVALAVRLWESQELSSAAHQALVKLRAAGVDVDHTAPAIVEHKVRANEPAFGPLLAAVQAGKVVTFDYRKQSDTSVTHRTVEPWGVVAARGRWYLVGHDQGRAAPRCFRLSRIVGIPKAVGKEGAVHRPTGIDLTQMVAGDLEPMPPSTAARIWVARDRAHGVRRWAKPVETHVLAGEPGDVMEIDLSHPRSAASWLAGYGPNVVVLEPQSLRDNVRELLRQAAEGTS